MKRLRMENGDVVDGDSTDADVEETPRCPECDRPLALGVGGTLACYDCNVSYQGVPER